MRNILCKPSYNLASETETFSFELRELSSPSKGQWWARKVERGQESSARYEIWNYLQTWPISYQKAIKSFRDLEITSHPDISLESELFLQFAISLRRERNACCLNDFFPFISSTFLLTARHHRHEEEALPASSVETRSMETTAPQPRRSPSFSFSFSRDRLDGQFLFSCGKRLTVLNCLNQEFLIDVWSRRYISGKWWGRFSWISSIELNI